MNCQEYKGMIEDALDISLNGELEANICRHLDHCPECREHLAMRRQEHAAFFTGVNAAYSHLRQPPADFADRVVREVTAQRNARRGWRRLSLPRWALIAASVAVMAGFVFAATVVVEGLRGTEAANQDDVAANQDGNHGDEMVGRATLGAPQTTDAALTDDELVGRAVPSAPQTGAQLETNQKGETVMSKVKAAAAALTAAFTAAPLASASGDEYQFIDPTTYPAENVSYSARSSAIAVDSGALRVASVSDNLEARSRTKGASSAIMLDATKWHGMIISVF